MWYVWVGIIRGWALILHRVDYGPVEGRRANIAVCALCRRQTPLSDKRPLPFRYMAHMGLILEGATPPIGPM